MARQAIDDNNLDKVVGGSIEFSTDHTTCGLNCSNQCRVNDYNACIQFIRDNHQTMSERDMLRQMVSLGYITRL